MKTWKLSIKPNHDGDFDPFALCKRKSLIGVGWSGAYMEKQANNITDAKTLVMEKYGHWPYAIKYLLEKVEPGDHVWLHQGGGYYLCQASSVIVLGDAIDKDYMSYDLGHARKAKWIKIPEEYVTGSIQRGTIAQRMIQKIRVTNKEEEFHKILIRNLSQDPKWQPVIDNSILGRQIADMKEQDMFALMTPDDMEDIVSAYLQFQGWVLIKSTCYRSKPVFEFAMQNKNYETCRVQVKSGNSPDQLPPSKYEKHTAPQTTIYLFSTHKNAYPGPTVEGVKTIAPTEVMACIKENIWVLTMPLRQRLWIFLNENIR